jgi:hypothetical protein
MSDNRKVTRYVVAYGTIERDVHGPFVEYEEYRAMKDELGEQLRTLQRRLDVRENSGMTHSEECYKWHHECAVRKVERERERAERAERERDEWQAVTILAQEYEMSVSYGDGLWTAISKDGTQMWAEKSIGVLAESVQMDNYEDKGGDDDT